MGALIQGLPSARPELLGFKDVFRWRWDRRTGTRLWFGTAASRWRLSLDEVNVSTRRLAAADALAERSSRTKRWVHLMR